MTMSLTSKTHPYKAGFEPFATEIYRIPYAYCYRCSYSLNFHRAMFSARITLKIRSNAWSQSEAVAAVVVEPVSRRRRFRRAAARILRRASGYLPAARHSFHRRRSADRLRTYRHDVRLRALRHDCRTFLLAPNPSAAGMPLAAVTGRAEIMDAAGVGALGGTYGGNPLACAAALAAIETIERENLPARAESSDNILTRARAIGSSVAARRRRARAGSHARSGIGASRETREPAKEETEEVLRHCRESGLIVLSAGSYGNVLRLLVPLVVTDAQFDEGLNILEASLAAVAESPVAEPRLV